MKKINEKVKQELNDKSIYPKTFFYQQSPEHLQQNSLDLGQASLNDSEALVVSTGTFTGRSPKDKFIVEDAQTKGNIDWNTFNLPLNSQYFNVLLQDITLHLKDKNIWVRDAYACDHKDYRISLRVINEHPWSNLFVYNMFLRPDENELIDFNAEWLIIQAPNFYADPKKHGTRQSNFSVISFSAKTILIGGSAYTGEIKKGVFTVLNYLLPLQKNVLSMHCSANKGQQDTAVFFGLSGTGKTTLSADPKRGLIGDDEHAWTDEGVFNFEGGCYAKCIDLSAEKEPDIFNAIKKGALVENVTFFPNTKTINFADKSITENTRVSYPLHYIKNALTPAQGDHPKNIFFLTCDAFGVLPPISKLSIGQAMFHFLSGYTAKIAGTEDGIKEPVSTFSTCFGAPFLPLHSVKYATLLGQKLKAHKTQVWLINTGWTGGAYGIGNRIKLAYTRAMINEVLNGDLLNAKFEADPVFHVQIPLACKHVPSELLRPINTWQDKVAYNEKAIHLAFLFNTNFEQFEAQSNDEIRSAKPFLK